MAPKIAVVEIPYEKLVDPSADLSQEIIKVRVTRVMYKVSSHLQSCGMAVWSSKRQPSHKSSPAVAAVFAGIWP
jgi:hypothetical protein